MAKKSNPANRPVAAPGSAGALGLDGWLYLVLLLSIVISFLTLRVNPQTFWPAAVPGLLLPWLFGANLLALIYWGLKQRWLLMGVATFTLLLGMDYWPRLGGWATEEGLRVTTLNCHGFLQDGQLADPIVIAAYFAGFESDIICLQEFPYTRREASVYTKAIRQETGLQHSYRDKDGGLAIFSRYPLSNAKAHFFANGANGYLSADVETPAGIIRVFNVHLQTNAITDMAKEVSAHGDLQKTETWMTIRGMLGRYGRSARRRVPQAKEILRLAIESPHPALLCGDFNEVPGSYIYRQINGRYRDAFVDAGRGIGSTYAGPLPGLRIDYIFYNARWQATHCRTKSVPFSDHRAVTATIPMKTQ